TALMARLRPASRPSPACGTRSPGSTPSPPTSGNSSKRLHDQDAADVLAVAQVLVALVDVVERVGPGDHRVEVEQTVPVEAEQPGDVCPGVDRAENAADDLLLPLGQAEQAQPRVGVGDRMDVG